MPRVPKENTTIGQRYALCIGIGTYTKLANRNLRYAVADAKAIAERLGDPQRGNFAVTLLTEPSQTTEHMLRLTLDKMLNGSDLNAVDLVVIYLSCHGDVYGKGHTFYLQPSDAEVEADGRPKRLTVIDIYGLATILNEARVKNIILLLDVCHSGGAGAVLEHLDLNLNSDTNLFVIGAARHDQTATQYSTLKHGLFTSCLLQAFEQKPRRSDGWLTITDTLSFVTEAIKVEASKLSGQEGPVQIQQRSASVNLNLLLVKNPHYSTESCDFHVTVKKLLELVNYEPVQATIPPGALAGFYVAETKAGLRTHRVGIIPYYNQVEPLTAEDAEKIVLFVKEQVEQYSLNEGLVVTVLEVSREVRETFQKSEARYLDVSTYESIWKRLIDFNKYLQKLVNEYRTVAPERQDDPPLEKVYIPLRAERRRYSYQADASTASVAATRLTAVSVEMYKVTWKEDLEQEVKSWLSDPSTTRLAVLADYGSGKSTFCQHLAATLARDYLSAQEHERYQQRIPLLIPLRDFSRTPVDLKGYLVSYLKQYCRVDNPDVEALMKMAEAGLLLFLLDGFDEMASRATNDTVAMNIEQFEQLANVSQNKVLLTTRPEYFLTLLQEQQVLQAYPCLYLQPFDEEQVNLYLQKRVPFLKPYGDEPIKDWTYYRQQIDEIHDLSDLVRRPVLLEMIVKTLPVLIAEGEAVNRPNLYQRYLEGELERQIRKQRRDLRIKREKRFEIMERIAVELYRTDRAELTSKEILKISNELLTPEQQDEMEGSLREIVTCSFLIRIGNEYRFSHQSFLEYLVALHLAKDIRDGKQETLWLNLLTRAIRDFLLEMEAGVVQRSSSTADADTTIVSFDKEILKRWFRANPKSGLSSNIVSLLNKLLPPEQLRQLPLAGANLESADLESADLESANLSGANLSGANLERANLSGARLHGADLEEANIGGANLERANLSGAKLRGANLRGAKLRGANLYRTNLYGMNFSRMNLNEVNFGGAILHRANLRGAKLRGTDLHDADLGKAVLHGANLIKAVLSGADLGEANLHRADLQEADLRGANLHGANLHGANLRDAILEGAILEGADLGEADLRDAILEGAILEGAILEGAILEGPTFRKKRD
jgi:uncharacterized protein YjbI with pentapeptide repeats